MGTKTLRQQQKLTILESSHNLGIKEVAKIAGAAHGGCGTWPLTSKRGFSFTLPIAFSRASEFLEP